MLNLKKRLLEKQDKWQQEQVAKDPYHEKIPNEDLNMGNIVVEKLPSEENIPVLGKKDMVTPEESERDSVNTNNIESEEEKQTGEFLKEKQKADEAGKFPENKGIKVEEASNEDFENVTLKTENKDVGDIVPKKERGVPFDESKTEGMLANVPQKEVRESLESTSGPEQLLIDEFGISKERIATIDGFGELTHGQQNLVIENLRTAKLGMIQNGAERQFKKDTAEARFVGKVWNSLSKGWKISSLEQSTKKDLDKGGIDIYGETLINLVGVAKDGPGVEYVNGEAVVQYAPDFEGLEPQQEEELKHFNEVANAFTKIPDEWGYESASKRERSQFEAAQTEYTKAKKQMIGLNLEQRKSCR